MCTCLLSFDPDSPVPVLAVGVRDEYADRAWDPPAAHWPDSPGLIGGRDRLAGGTWLAVNPAAHRLGVVLNGCGIAAPAEGRLSRGDLPLRAAEHGDLGPLDPARFDPFHLICAEPGKVRLWTWTGLDLTDRWLDPGVHLVVNTGLDATCPGPSSIPEAALEGIRARLAHFRPLLESTPRPNPADDAPTSSAWGPWLPLADGASLPFDDPRALLHRHTTDDGRTFGTTSVSLVALSPETTRYDFSATPGTPTAWTRILPT
ncbi:NRDE family protein [Actinocorallia sp. A-T 12471]|uniref:NRDE family protein n=1 Tax=Actinocorallia sp. A-T 12471 TaxID=3089813 RepID=UPI0029CD96A8|nr:NRDE family protein [Actinocorallia sp. A-T 12471]MDX6744305.1 NRDE family protein [Actinocorallia sp. A-T 12471]